MTCCWGSVAGPALPAGHLLGLHGTWGHSLGLLSPPEKQQKLRQQPPLLVTSYLSCRKALTGLGYLCNPDI